jgi:hypothetical protein
VAALIERKLRRFMLHLVVIMLAHVVPPAAVRSLQ